MHQNYLAKILLHNDSHQPSLRSGFERETDTRGTFHTFFSENLTSTAQYF